MKMDELETIFKNVKKRYDKRKQEKFNKKTRCPWCGNVLLWDRRKIRFNKSLKCSICGKNCIPIDLITIRCLEIALLICLYLLFCFSCSEIERAIFAIILSIFFAKVFSIYEHNVPYRRIKGKRIWERIFKTEDLTEPILFYARITWNCSKWRIFKFWSSKLLIIIAVDENNQPISHPLCVRIRKCKTGYELTKIVRILKFDKKSCKRFFVYWGDELVGEGTVISKFYL